MKIGLKMEYLKAIYERYHKGDKKLKSKILDEYCRVCGYNRKYATRKVNGPSPEDKAIERHRRKRSFTYGPQVIQVLSEIWQTAGYPCSVRLKALVPLWMPWIEKRFRLTAKLKEQLLEISPRQMDRRFRSRKLKLKKRIYGRTKPGTLLKHQIPIKTDHWDVQVPGFTEVDLVSHSGNCADGEFVYSVNQTDILSSWVETGAVLGKGERNVSKALDEMEQAFPFKILGMDSDNGSEFINYHLYRRCRKKGIQLTRSRPYKKNDNAHIEQKNWTHVRKLLGWDRYDTQEAVQALNDLYRNELRLLMNLFMPSMKLKSKKRVGSRLKRVYDKPQTPLDRVIASAKGDPVKIEQLKMLRDNVDPFELAHRIDRKLHRIHKMANHSQKTKMGKQRRQISANQLQRQTMQQTFGVGVYVSRASA
jgi:transposase InsO family protein